MIDVYKPEGCTYPDCFSCRLPDCEYDDEQIRLDEQAARAKKRRHANPEHYLAAQRRQKALMEQRDPGHYARLQKQYRERKKLANA